jgi:hypothetical protein
MNNFSPNISIFRDITAVIDTDEMINMNRIYHWKVIDNDHIQIEVRSPEDPRRYIICEFQGDGIISFESNTYFMDINRFFYSQTLCRKEFRKILREKYDIKI